MGCVAAVALTAIGTFHTAMAEAPSQPPPNIVLILSDDHAWYDVSAYGSDNVHTPNIDRLAEQGMRFDAMTTATAMCSPTRQQLYTGLYPVRNGAWPNHSHVYRGTRSMVHHLQDLGYRVGLSGKGHIGPRDSFPFESLGGRQYNFDNIEAFINRDPEQPFCLVLASHEPHAPWEKGDCSKFDRDQLQLPPYLADTPEQRELYAKYLAEIREVDRQVGRIDDLVEQAGKSDQTLFIWTSEQGSQFPGAKWTCYEAGLKTAFVVRWPGKVEPGSTTDALAEYVDLVPTLVEIAGGDPGTIDTGLPGSPHQHAHGFDGRSFLPVLLGEADRHKDFAFGIHTTLGIIGATRPYPIRSVRDERFKLIWNINHEAPFENIITERNRDGLWESWLQAAEQDEHAAAMVRRYQHRPEFELYDLQQDPFELNNLIDDPRRSTVRQRLQERLQAWMKQQGDTGLEIERRALRLKQQRPPDPDSRR